MKNLHLTKRQMKDIEHGIQVDVYLGGFLAYCIKDEYADFQTDSGCRFSVNFYALTCTELTINGKEQNDIWGK